MLLYFLGQLLDNSVGNKGIPSNSIVVGNSCKVIKKI